MRYRHDLFQQDRPDLCDQISSSAPNKPKHAVRRDSEALPKTNEKPAESSSIVSDEDLTRSSPRVVHNETKQSYCAPPRFLGPPVMRPYTRIVASSLPRFPSSSLSEPHEDSLFRQGVHFLKTDPSRLGPFLRSVDRSQLLRELTKWNRSHPYLVDQFLRALENSQYTGDSN